VEVVEADWHHCCCHHHHHLLDPLDCSLLVGDVAEICSSDCHWKRSKEPEELEEEDG
jgi:hypothetical protein